jgi:phosphate transport system permease protein
MNKRSFHRLQDKAFQYWGVFSTLVGLILLAVFIGSILIDGVGRLDWQFVTSLPSRKAENAGVLTAWTGSLWLFVMTAVISIPIGVAAGIHLEEYVKKNRWSSFLEINITNLAGVPSIIYGILGLGIFVRTLHFGGSLLAGGCTLSLLILPIIIVATREAIKSVPSSIKEASFGMGATKWQTIWYQVLPASRGGIATGIILALS